MNEAFWKDEFVPKLETGMCATYEEVLQDCDKPDIKETKSAALSTVFRIGDMGSLPDAAIEITVRTAKATAITRPPTMKKFAKREQKNVKDAMDVDEADAPDPSTNIYVELKQSTDYYAKNAAAKEENENDDIEDLPIDKLDKIDKEETVNVLKYGSSWVVEPDGPFVTLDTRKGIDLYGVFPESKVDFQAHMKSVSLSLVVSTGLGHGRGHVCLAQRHVWKTAGCALIDRARYDREGSVRVLSLHHARRQRP